MICGKLCNGGFCINKELYAGKGEGRVGERRVEGEGERRVEGEGEGRRGVGNGKLYKLSPERRNS